MEGLNSTPNVSGEVGRGERVVPLAKSEKPIKLFRRSRFPRLMFYLFFRLLPLNAVLVPVSSDSSGSMRKYHAAEMSTCRNPVKLVLTRRQRGPRYTSRHIPFLQDDVQEERVLPLARRDEREKESIDSSTEKTTFPV